jgi:hypothetical protein
LYRSITVFGVAAARFSNPAITSPSMGLISRLIFAASSRNQGLSTIAL